MAWIRGEGGGVAGRGAVLPLHSAPTPSARARGGWGCPFGVEASCQPSELAQRLPRSRRLDGEDGRTDGTAAGPGPAQVPCPAAA